MSFIPWPEIVNFHSVRKCLLHYPELLRGRLAVLYRGKIKLHGTNAAIQVRGDKVFTQSRTKILALGEDDIKFAAWVEDRKQTIVEQVRAHTDKDVIIFGEFCGKGIMKGVAISQIPTKIFAVFSALELPVGDESQVISNPEDLAELVGTIPDVYVLPWHGDVTTIPMLEQPEVVQPLLDTINQEVLAIEACDPWVKSTFGVEGTGEGLVFYPINNSTWKATKDLMFKAKGEKHKTVAHAQPTQLDPSVAAGGEQFAELVLTEARLEQGARSIAGGELTFEKRLIGPFLAWVLGDVKKETTAELEASGLDWKQVQKFVSEKARNWYVEKSTQL